MIDLASESQASANVSVGHIDVKIQADSVNTGSKSKDKMKGKDFGVWLVWGCAFSRRSPTQEFAGLRAGQDRLQPLSAI
jgi:hypothetical protein